MTPSRKKFDLNDLVMRLRFAAKGDDPRAAIKTILEDAVKDPQHVQDGIPTFEDNDTILFEDDTVSIWHCRFMPGYSVPAHDHQMFATIGVYRGAERNDFLENEPSAKAAKSNYRPVKPSQSGHLQFTLWVAPAKNPAVAFTSTSARLRRLIDTCSIRRTTKF